MKRIGAFFLLAGLVSAAAAQTNLLALADADTNGPSAAAAPAPATRAMSLQNCIVEALQHNFDVRHERYNPLKARLGLDLAYAGYDPTFNLSGAHNHNVAGGFVSTNGLHISDDNSFKSDLGGLSPIGTSYDLFGSVDSAYVPYPEQTAGQVGVQVTQPLLKNFWIDSTRLSVSAAKNNIHYTEQGLRSQLITTVTAVENAFYELIYAREYLNVQQQALELALTQLRQDRQRVEVGSLAPLDVQQDEAQAAQSRANLISAQFTLAQDQNALKNLITDNYLGWHDTDLEPQGTLEAVQQLFDVQDSWSKGMASRPDLLQAKLTLEQQGIQLKYDRNQLFPQLDLTGSFGYNGGGVGYSDTFDQYTAANRPFYAYGAQVSVPLSNLKARSNYKTDKAVEQQYLLKLKQLEQTVMVDIDNAVKQAQSGWESVSATRQARIYAEAALDAEQKKYAVGKSTTFTVLQLQNNLTSARSQEIRSLANYNQFLANLAQVEGTTLERRHVDVTAK